MSGTFSGVGALQFSPDNKTAYGYSGVVNTGTSFISLLEFSTNSEYIMGKVQNYSATITGADIFLKISYNDTVILSMAYNQQGQLDPAGTIPHHLIIPPFTDVKIEQRVVSGTSDLTVIFTGKVGMPQRVGNK